MTPLFFVLLVLVSEMILGFLFSAIAQLFFKKIGIDFRSLLKGIVERAFLFFSLLYNYPHALTLFGALKLATRLKLNADKMEDEEKFNNFYLIGNFISVTISIAYVEVYRHFFNN